MTSEPCQLDRLPAERVAFVDEIHQRFVQAFGLALTDYLDRPVKGASGGIGQMTLEEFLEAGSDACVVRYDLSPMRGQTWASLGQGLIFRVLDILLGAPATAGASPRSNLTEIERHVLGEFFQSLRNALEDAWKSNGISFEMVSAATAQEARQAADLETAALVLDCRLRFGEDEEKFRVAVPILAVRLAALQSERNAAQELAGETAARNALLKIVSDARLEVEAVLAGSSIRLGDLATLQPGQVLMLTRPAGSQLDFTINGKAKFRGDWVANGDRHGLQLDTLIDSAPAGKV